MVSRWFKLGFVALAIAAVGVIAETGVAQPPGQRGPGGPGGAPRMMLGAPGGGVNPGGLLRLEQVQKEIELLDEQKADVDKVFEESRAAMQELMGGLRGLDREQMQERRAELVQKMRAHREEVAKKLEGILLPHQLERLEQIRIQMMGGQALNDEKVAEKLGLSDAQKEKLQQVQASAREKMREAFQEMRGQDGERPDREAMQQQMQQIREEIEKEMLDVLTSEQKEKLEKMKGEPFELDRAAMGRRVRQQRDGARAGEGRRPRAGRRGGN